MKITFKDLKDRPHEISNVVHYQVDHKEKYILLTLTVSNTPMYGFNVQQYHALQVKCENDG